MLDFAESAIDNFNSRVTHFPENQIIKENFFLHKEKYDIIIEFAFFSSIKKGERGAYATKMFDLLLQKGKLIGLLFNHEFKNNFPPFGGTKEELDIEAFS